MNRSEILRSSRTAGYEVVQQLLDGRASYGFAFQPMVDLKRGVVTGYEALARFPEELGLRPDEVFQMAGQCGLRQELEGRTALAALLSRQLLPENCFLSVNAGPTLLLSPNWDEVLEQVGRLDTVVIEVTEDEPVPDYPLLRRRLERIRDLGGHVAVDDTGTGYSSLKHVMELRPDFIKLDRFFVGGCHREPARMAMIEMLGNVASRLDAWIIAEGVETMEELEELIKLGVPLAQGFYLGRPQEEMLALPVELSEELLGRALALANGDLRRIVQRCQSCADAVEGQTQLAANLELTVVALTDGWGRPVGLMERHGGRLPRMIGQPMKVQAASDVHEVLHRALTRAPERRFDPIAVIDEQGVLEGVVMTDRLMRLAMEMKPTEAEAVPLPPANVPVERRLGDRRLGDRRAGWR